MPLEGGLYQWATVGLGEFLGFLTAWNLWAYTIVIMAVFGVMIATNLSYLLAPMGATFTNATWYTPVVSSTAVIRAHARLAVRSARRQVAAGHRRLRRRS